MEKDIKLKPRCLEGKIAFAVTNRGHLIPCCRCDDWVTMNDPEFQKLLDVSRIEDHESIDQILSKPEWIEFAKNLQQHRGPDACITTCREDKPDDKKQVRKKIDTKINEVLYISKI